MKDGTLESKVALVTGGSTGIGRATALRLAEAGARVLITGRNQDSLEEAASRHASIGWVVADVAREEDARRTIEEVQKRHGRLDLLVNNAGIAFPAPLEAADPQHVRKQFDVNVLGLVEVTRQALPLLRASKGAIVNVASIVADQPFAGMSVYAATKAAVLALTRAWAKELGPEGIRVNVVSPGPVETPILAKTGMSAADLDRMASGILERVPMKRFGQPEEVAEVIAFLGSPGASFVNGAQYGVGGGAEA